MAIKRKTMVRKKTLKIWILRKALKKYLQLYLVQQILKCCLLSVYFIYFQYEHCSMNTSGILRQFAPFAI